MTVQQYAREGIQSRIAPRLSVILCTYNRCNLVLSALASLRRQTLPYEQFEVIVIDNGSTDGTINTVREYVRAGTLPDKAPEDIWQVQCLSEPHNGLAYARHTGLLVAASEIVVFLDDDTIADPHLLEHLLNTYEETGADAIGGSVELRWEASRPHWLTDDLLDMLGYYAPAPTRLQIQEGSSFSSSNFSVKIEALRSIGSFSPFLSKRMQVPTSMEIQDLCNRLHGAGYSLWYEPGAAVAHRVPKARLKRAYFVGRAYWQGRSEALTQYAGAMRAGQTMRYAKAPVVKSVLHELRDILHLALVQRPLLHLAARPSSERLLAEMEQARCWGHLRQRLQFLEHAPPEVTTPAVLLVRSPEQDQTAELLARSLALQDVACTTSFIDIPIAWLWRHRAYDGQAMGIVHFYRPGAFNPTRHQLQGFWLRLWLARHWGIRIVTTDTGGWWQCTRNLRFLSRRMLERNLMQQSDVVLTYTRQPAQLYADKKLRRRVRCLPHPGFRGSYAAPVDRLAAYKQLGLPPDAGFVYLCFAHTHTERELLHLMRAFDEVKQHCLSSPENNAQLPNSSTAARDKKRTFRRDARRLGSQSRSGHSAESRSAALQEAQEQKVHAANPQLLIVGLPPEKRQGRYELRLYKLAASNSSIHLCMSPVAQDDIPLYMGAADAIVLPHFALPNAGMLETALLALSFERVVIAPNLPRFRGMLPPRASILYDPNSQKSLVQACISAQNLHYHMNDKESSALDAESGWGQYAHRVLKIYRQLLQGRQYS
ncbi:MAG TPA: glycosyltransferase [Ktedonobacteraceae bacterium]|nr:glycosyltransferase [Ktedonobacteraceae bacterium]